MRIGLATIYFFSKIIIVLIDKHEKSRLKKKRPQIFRNR